MQKAEFSEKTFEFFLNSEIGRHTYAVFAPGQIDEHPLGWDFGAYVDGVLLSRIHHRALLGGYYGLRKSEVDRFAKELSKHLPPIRFNLFLQHKLAVRLVSSGAGQWADWEEPYFRYEVNPDQQQTLCRLDEVSSGRALVLYSCFAGIQSDELHQHHRSQSIIENTNFTEAANLGQHQKVTFVGPGNIAKAHSEAEDIESRSFERIIKDGMEQDELDLVQNTKKLAQLLQRLLEKDDRNLTRVRGIIEASGVQSAEIDLEQSYRDGTLFVAAFEVCFGLKLHQFGKSVP